MNFEPRPHQALALDFLHNHKRAGLLLDMGLGKTVVTLTRIKELADDFAISKSLVIAPLRVAQDTWSREQDKWDHLRDLRVSKVLGSEKERRAGLAADADIYVINRENVQWLCEYLAPDWPFDLVVIDELSSFKSPTSKRWRCLRKMIGMSTYVIGLTGTPAPNGYMDLWPEMYLLDSGERLGRTLGEFRNKYFSAGAHKGYIVYEWRLKNGAKEVIDTKLSDLCLSMSKKDWLQLPPVMYNQVMVRMTDQERTLYDRLKRDAVLPILDKEVGDLRNYDELVVGATAATLSNKLLQLANGAVYTDKNEVVRIHDQKINALQEILEANEGQNIMCFYTYKHDLERIKEAVPTAVELKDSDTIAQWNDGKIPLLLVHPASAGHGLNLQAGGHIIVWFGLPWSLELYQQANARLDRMGQEHSVMIHHIVTEGTVDERVLSVLHSKDNTQKGLLEALKAEVRTVAR